MKAAVVVHEGPGIGCTCTRAHDGAGGRGTHRNSRSDQYGNACQSQSKLVELVELDLVELGRSVASITSEETEEWHITKCCYW